MKKINLEEQFEFPLEDGTSEEVAAADLKEKEKSDKELNKAMKATEKEVEEINGDKHNSLTEKLTLPEPMPILNESAELQEGALTAAVLAFAKSTLLPILIQTASQILIEKVIEYMDKHNIKVEDGDVKLTLTKLVSDTLQQALDSAAKNPEMQSEELGEGLLGGLINSAVGAYDALKDAFGEGYIEGIATGTQKLIPEEFYEGINAINEGLALNIARMGITGVSGLFMESDNLDEALPKDLAKAYRNFDSINTKDKGEVYPRNNYGGIYRKPTIDFQNSEYTEATPEDIFALRKAGQLSKARIIFDGQLIAYDDNNKQLTKAIRWGSNNRALYINSNNGTLADATTGIPFKDIVNRAEKLYIVDSEPDVDPQLRADRSANPESRYYNPSVGYHDMYGQEDVLGQSTRGFSSWSGSLRDNPRSRGSHDRIVDVMNNKDHLIDRWSKERDKETPGSYNYNYYNNAITGAKDEKVRALNDYRDSAAAIRNADANMALKKPLRTYRDLKQQLDDDKNRLARSQTNLANAQQNGSPATRTTRVDLEQAYNELKRLRRRIMELEDQLDGADLADSAEVKKYQDAVNDYTSKIANTQADIDKLLRRNKP